MNIKESAVMTFANHDEYHPNGDSALWLRVNNTDRDMQRTSGLTTLNFFCPHMRFHERALGRFTQSL